MMKILGVDPGTVRCGYAVLQFENATPRPLDYGVVRPPRGTELPARLAIIHRGLSSLIQKHTPDVAAVEGAFYGANPRTAIKIGEARGIVLQAASSAGLEIHEYPPATVKKAVVGNGNASKEQVQEMVRVELSLREIPSPDDAADALALALCHCHRLRMNALT
ncbi:MAG: crossover junction endodeoxyribonuclease RuvC [Planctomycetota bacterium]